MTMTADDRDFIDQGKTILEQRWDGSYEEDQAKMYLGVILGKYEELVSAGVAPQEPSEWEHGVIGGEDLLARLMDTLAYYHCRSVNPKADSPYLGYHAMSEDQREFLREKQREAAEEVLRMWQSEGRPAPQEPSKCQHNIVSYTDSVTMRPEHFCSVCGYEPAPSPDREKLIADALEEVALRITADDDGSDRTNAEAEARADGFNDAMEIMEPYVQRLAALAAPVEVDEAKLVAIAARVYDEGAVDSPEDYPLQYGEAMQYGRDVASAAVKLLGGGE